MRERLWVALDVETLKEADGLLERLGGAGPAPGPGLLPDRQFADAGDVEMDPGRAGQLLLGGRRLGHDGSGGVAHHHQRLVAGQALGAVGDGARPAVGADPEQPLPLHLDGGLVGRAGQEQSESCQPTRDHPDSFRTQSPAPRRP